MLLEIFQLLYFCYQSFLLVNKLDDLVFTFRIQFSSDVLYYTLQLLLSLVLGVPDLLNSCLYFSHILIQFSQFCPQTSRLFSD